MLRADKVMRAEIPGAARFQPVTITGGGHFLQEDKGEELAKEVVAFIAATPRHGR